MPVFIDCETYSEENIKHGHFKYSENCEILMIAWAVNNGPVDIWDAKKDKYMPHTLRDILHGDDLLIAHNASFEQAVFTADLTGCVIDPRRWRCSMAKAYAHGLLGSLDGLSTILGLSQDKKKSKEGYDLIRLFCVPPPKNAKRGRATYETHPKEWEKFKDYCKQDIVAAREVWNRLPEWNYKGFELDLWHLDQRINQRGLPIDLALVKSAIRAVDREHIELKKRTQDITYGSVESPTQRDEMLAHILMAYGVELPDMQAGTLERRIDDPDLPPALKELLAIRLQSTTSSTAKYKKVLDCVSNDGRLRGTLQWCGAARTGRWSGRLFQPQNLVRSIYSKDQTEFVVQAFKSDCADILCGNVMASASNIIRGVIAAPKGKKLIISDLSNIEGRVQAWIAGEEWKLKAFRDFDRGVGHDIYVLAYAIAFHVSPESVLEDKKKGGNQRQIGKVLELAMGYHGGVGSFVTFASAYNVDLQDLSNKVWDFIPKDILEEAINFWDYSLKVDKTFGLDKKIFIVCDSLKRMWRRAHSRIVETWDAIEDAAIKAMGNKGETFVVGKLKFRRDGNWFRIILPSGRAICYPHPQFDKDGKISYMGVDQYSRKWQRISTYSGKLFENICQAVARDVMAYSMLQIEECGFEIITTIHDEVVCEAVNGLEDAASKLSQLLATSPKWAMTLPLAADGYEAYRYRKE